MINLLLRSNLSVTKFTKNLCLIDLGDKIDSYRLRESDIYEYISTPLNDTSFLPELILDTDRSAGVVLGLTRPTALGKSKLYTKYFLYYGSIFTFSTKELDILKENSTIPLIGMSDFFPCLVNDHCILPSAYLSLQKLNSILVNNDSLFNHLASTVNSGRSRILSIGDRTKILFDYYKAIIDIGEFSYTLNSNIGSNYNNSGYTPIEILYSSMKTSHLISFDACDIFVPTFKIDVTYFSTDRISDCVALYKQMKKVSQFRIPKFSTLDASSKSSEINKILDNFITTHIDFFNKAYDEIFDLSINDPAAVAMNTRAYTSKILNKEDSIKKLDNRELDCRFDLVERYWINNFNVNKLVKIDRSTSTDEYTYNILTILFHIRYLALQKSLKVNHYSRQEKEGPDGRLSHTSAYVTISKKNVIKILQSFDFSNIKDLYTLSTPHAISMSPMEQIEQEIKTSFSNLNI